MRKKSWSGRRKEQRRTPKKWSFKSLTLTPPLSDYVLSWDPRKEPNFMCYQLGKSFSINFSEEIRNIKHTPVSIPPFFYFVPVGLNAFNADSSKTDQKHMDGNHIAVSSTYPFWRVNTSCCFPESPWNWEQGLQSSCGWSFSAMVTLWSTATTGKWWNPGIICSATWATAGRERSTPSATTAIEYGTKTEQRCPSLSPKTRRKWFK